MEHFVSHHGYSACHALIGDAVLRCRQCEDLARITINIKLQGLNKESCPSFFQCSISDTAPGIGHGDFPKFYPYFSSTCSTVFCDDPLFWGGQLLIMTTDFVEEEVRQYQIDDAHHSPKLMQLRSFSKERGCYCGTNVTIHLKGYPEKLLMYIQNVCQKMAILMLKNIAIEVCFSSPTLEGSIREDMFLFSEGLSLPREFSNLERLSMGFINHICNGLEQGKRNSWKIGKALAGSSELASETLWSLEVCFAIMEGSDDDVSSFRGVDGTKVLYFQDFMHTGISASIVQLLKHKVNWEKFGLIIKDILVDEFGIAIIQWESSARVNRIELILHRYRNSQTRTNTWSKEANVLKRAVEESLHELKDTSPHLFMSHHALEIQKYAPDLSQCIARLITSSSDVSFKSSCAEILGVACTDFCAVEPIIRGKVFRSIEISDNISTQQACHKCDAGDVNTDIIKFDEHTEYQSSEGSEDESSGYDFCSR